MKKRPFLIIGNIIIWVFPIILILILGLEKYETFKEATTTEFRIKFWASFVIIIMAIIYWCKGKKLIKDHLLKAFVLEKRANPIWVILNSIFALIPIVAVKIIYDGLIAIKQDFTLLINVLLAIQILGRLFLILDSFKLGGKDEKVKE